MSAGEAKFQSPGQSPRCSANGSRAASPNPADLTAATLPAPPHCATSRPPGFSARAGGRTGVVVADPVERRGRDDRVDRLVELELEQVGLAHVDAGSAAAAAPPRPSPASRRRRSRARAAAARRARRSRGRCRSRRRAPSRRPRAPAAAARRAPSPRSAPTGARRRRRPSHVAAYVRTLSHTVPRFGGARRPISAAPAAVSGASGCAGERRLGGEVVGRGRVAGGTRKVRLGTHNSAHELVDRAVGELLSQDEQLASPQPTDRVRPIASLPSPLRSRRRRARRAGEAARHASSAGPSSSGTACAFAM